jgi:hypothetical protein
VKIYSTPLTTKYTSPSNALDRERMSLCGSYISTLPWDELLEKVRYGRQRFAYFSSEVSSDISLAVPSKAQFSQIPSPVGFWGNSLTRSSLCIVEKEWIFGTISIFEKFNPEGVRIIVMYQACLNVSMWILFGRRE